MPVPEPTLNHKTAAKLLADRGFTISGTAKAIDEDRSHLSNVLSGRRRGGVRLIRKLAEHLEVDPYVLIGPGDVKSAREALIEVAREFGITAEDIGAAS